MNTVEQLLYNMFMKDPILGLVTGSTSYGLNNEDSDVDEKWVSNYPKNLFFTLDNKIETLAIHIPKDLEIHTLRKFLTLLKTQNPTITEMVWADERFILHKSKIGQSIIDERQMFLCSDVYHSFGGYAKQQLMRIKNGLEKATDEDKMEHLDYTMNRLIDSFPNKYTEAKSGILHVNDVIILDDGKQNVNMKVDFDNISLTQLQGMISELYNTMKTYNKMGKRNRKPEGKLTKHAMHLLRLLITGIEVLETGLLQVYRTKDRELLMDIRNGKYTWKEFFEIVRFYQQKLVDAYKKTVLPPQVDAARINEFYSDMMITSLAM